jgi:geranylgeranyl reductase
VTTDVLIVGAGPAGISAARTLLDGGARVTLLDRHERPGGKACGGGLTADSWELAGIDPGRPPTWVRVHERLRVHGRAGRIELPGRGPLLAVVDRQAWIGSALEELADRGCEVRLGERLVGVEPGVATTDRSRIDCKLIVGADGARSRVRRRLGLGRGPQMRALQLVVDADTADAAGLDTSAPTVWFDPARFGAGYGWAFPAPGQVRFGCGVSSRSPAARRLKSSFHSWLGELGLSRERGRLQAGTIDCGYLGHRFGRTFLAGDAAGLASPLTGEGIAQALLSGREVAREILEPGYRSELVPRLARRHRRTHDTLALPVVGSSLLSLAPLLLRVPGIRKQALARYAAAPL